MSRPKLLFFAMILTLGFTAMTCQAATGSDNQGFRIAASAEAGRPFRKVANRAGTSPVHAKLAVSGRPAVVPARSLSGRRPVAGKIAGPARRSERVVARHRPSGRDADIVGRRGGRAGTQVRDGAASALARATKASAPASAAALPFAGAGAGAGARAGAGAEATRMIAPAVSMGSALGLHRVADPLDLRSGTALVVDQATGEVLFEKNPQYVLPIASLTKLMTAMVVLDAGQPLDEVIEVVSDDRDTDRYSASHLPVGSHLSRRELLQLALMASENRAAAALARTYPGGFDAYVRAANRKAAALGMVDSVFADGTGLSAANVSTAHDLAKMASAAGRYPQIAEMSLATSMTVRLPGGSRSFHTTNRLVGSPNWELELQKTGYITEAGNCLLLQAKVDERSLIVVLLDSWGRYSRIGDAERIRRWLESNPA